MPPFEKKGGILFCTYSSVDQAMSAQYLFTSLFESCQTWHMDAVRQWMTPIDFQVTWS